MPKIGSAKLPKIRQTSRERSHKKKRKEYLTMLEHIFLHNGCVVSEIKRLFETN